MLPLILRENNYWITSLRVHSCSRYWIFKCLGILY